MSATDEPSKVSSCRGSEHQQQQQQQQQHTVGPTGKSSSCTFVTHRPRHGHTTINTETMIVIIISSSSSSRIIIVNVIVACNSKIHLSFIVPTRLEDASDSTYSGCGV
jgi:hypothetical protein